MSVDNPRNAQGSNRCLYRRANRGRSAVCGPEALGITAAPMSRRRTPSWSTRDEYTTRVGLHKKGSNINGFKHAKQILPLRPAVTGSRASFRH